jgi:uncharacterized membrane protein
MASSTLPATSASRSRFKTVLWISLGVTTLFVFITSEVLLVTDYPMYHAYRLQVIADRGLLIPHTLCGTFALLSGPLQFSTRFRQRHLKLHRVLGRMYLVSVIIGASTGMALAWGRPGLPGTSMQGAAWIVCTIAAVIAARNRQVSVHRQWMARSYAVTFTFVSSRVLNLLPAYWSHLGDVLSAVGVIAFTLASILLVDIGLNWHELTTRRS